MNENQLFNNLKALEDASFPKACSNCGKRYENEQAFISQTTAYQSAPQVSESIDEAGNTYIKIARQCACGQAILDHFGDRRDTSEQGDVRRLAFDKVVKQLVEHGLTAEQAREELINHMHNKKSPLLEKLGVFTR
ncbi:hypothetical protein FLL45_14765 [Aliikangiella marina]|uniref:Uncharacterized protein n=1 Tax=Aliikangiella marina TaxID=1712262 RepID=A0A545TA76_9GAMM|nr:hypothetical protein [Aliikangiella marina]TQV74116.1 hypothetical protein FLL45_14765 [Aliikangiella marina]